MSVYDKELIIDGKAVRSPEQQVYKNMKDIESLQDTIKPEYKCTVELSTSATSVAKSNTNAGTDVKSGWLLDPKGKKFKITGGDDDNLLIDFYTSYQGPQGESGADDIDDSAIANNKVWSSQKVNNSLDKGIFTTMVEPTDLGGGAEFRLDYEDTPILTSGIHVRVNDLIIYIDGDDKAKSIYSVSAVYDEYVYLAKQGDFGGGKQLYQHNIYYSYTGTLVGKASFTIICDRETSFTFSDLVSYLRDNGFTASNKTIMAGGSFYHTGNSNSFRIWDVYSSASGTLSFTYVQVNQYSAQTDNITSGTIVDTVTPL